MTAEAISNWFIHLTWNYDVLQVSVGCRVLEKHSGLTRGQSTLATAGCCRQCSRILFKNLFQISKTLFLRFFLNGQVKKVVSKSLDLSLLKCITSQVYWVIRTVTAEFSTQQFSSFPAPWAWPAEPSPNERAWLIICTVRLCSVSLVSKTESKLLKVFKCFFFEI